MNLPLSVSISCEDRLKQVVCCNQINGCFRRYNLLMIGAYSSAPILMSEV